MTPTSQSARMGAFSAILEKALLGVRQSKDPITSSPAFSIWCLTSRPSSGLERLYS